MYEKIEHFCLKCISHIFEKIEFKEELKKFLKKVFQVAWDEAIRVAQLRSQLSSACREIFSLESLLAFREAQWKIVAQSIEFQDELCRAQKKIAKLELLVRGKEAILVQKLGDHH